MIETDVIVALLILFVAALVLIGLAMWSYRRLILDLEREVANLRDRVAALNRPPNGG